MFSSLGAKVALCGRDHERLKSVLDKVVKVSGGCKDMFLTVQGDINDSRVRKEIVGKTTDKFGRLDFLVGNAGVSGKRQLVTAATEETYDTIMNTNLKSLFFLIQEAVPHLEKSKGNIITVSSFITRFFCPDTVIDSLSKVATFDHLTKTLAFDLASKGIRTNTVSPGFIPTRMLRFHGDKTSLATTAVYNFDRSRQILTDRCLSMDAITAAVAFLASDEAAFVTGEVIVIDGGRHFNGYPNWSIGKAKP